MVPAQSWGPKSWGFEALGGGTLLCKPKGTHLSHSFLSPFPPVVCLLLLPQLHTQLGSYANTAIFFLVERLYPWAYPNPT